VSGPADFYLEDRGGTVVVVFAAGGVRPASDVEVALWREVERLINEHELAPPLRAVDAGQEADRIMAEAERKRIEREAEER